MPTAVGSVSGLTHISRCCCRAVLAAVILFGTAPALLADLPVWEGVDSLMESPAQRAFLTPDRSRLVLLLEEGDADKVIEIPLRNQLLPSVELELSMVPERLPDIAYRYTLGNGSGAIDPIGMWSIVAPQSAQIEVAHDIRGPHPPWAAWVASVPVARQARLGSDLPPGRYVTWLRHEHSGEVSEAIAPGEEMNGFVVRSNFKPGFTTAYFYQGEYISLDPTWPLDLQYQLKDFWEDVSLRQPTLLVIGPALADDASVEAVLKNYRMGIEALLVEGRLDDSSPLISILDRLAQGEPAPREWPQFATGLEEEIAVGLGFALGADTDDR